MSSTLQWSLIAAVALLLVWWLVRRRASAGPTADDRIDTLTGWPPQATRVLTSRESVAYGSLVRALPDYMVLAQVPLARFLSVPKRNSYADWLRRLGYQCIDFAVCDMAAQVVAVIELQPAGGLTSDRARKRAQRMARSLKAARIPLLVWPENALPTGNAMREAVLAKATAPSPRTVPLSTVTAPVTATAPGPVPAPAFAMATTPTVAMTKPATDTPPAIDPFADTDRDPSRDPGDDDTLELLEPPSSTWFDDLDSEPVPLRKR